MKCFFKKSKAQVNLVKLTGLISNKEKGLSFTNVKKHLDTAFKSSKSNKPKGVILVINSPGGSPAQSEMIANYIRYLSDKNNIPVYAFVEDVAASGGFWLACSADKIYALSSSSIVGSLGVVSAGFGLEDFISKHSINRRVYTSGESKVTLDMFQKEKKADVEKLKTVLSEIHEHFKDWVRERRDEHINYEKLEKDNIDIFSGEYWVASKAVRYGIIDGIYPEVYTFAKEEFGENVKVKCILDKKPLFKMPSLNIKSEDLIQEIKNSYKSDIISSKYDIY